MSDIIKSAIINAINQNNLQDVIDILKAGIYQTRTPTKDYVAALILDEDTGTMFLHRVAATGLVGVFPYLQSNGELRNSAQPYSAYRDALSVQDKFGRTPLHVAVVHDRLEVVKAIYGLVGRSDVDVAEDGRTVVVDVDVDHGVLDEEWRDPKKEFLEIRNLDGRTALDEALFLGRLEIVEWLRWVGGAEGVL